MTQPTEPTNRPTQTRYVALGWFCLAATIAYIARNSLGVAESTIRRDLRLTEADMGIILPAFFLTYAVFQLPAGWIAERYGTRRVLSLLAIGWSLATATTSLATGFPSLIAARLANGAAQAGVFSCTTNSFSHWFARTERAIASGALGAFMSVGGAAGAALTGVLLERLDWQTVFALFGLLGVVWSAAFFAWFRDQPADHRGVNVAELEHIRAGQPPAVESSAGAERPPTPWAAILCSGAMWAISGQQFFRAAGQNFFATWFPTYLQETREVSVKGSGLLTSLPLLGIFAGSLLGGFASDWLLARTGSKRIARQGVAAVSLVACAGLIAVAYFVQDPLLASLVIAAGTFCAAFAGPCAYAITIDMGGRNVATVFSMMNMVGNIGAMLFPWFTPHFKRFVESSPAIRELTGGSGWDSVLILFGAMYVGAAACWLVLNPNGTIGERN